MNATAIALEQAYIVAAAHKARLSARPLSELFASDPDRFGAMSTAADGILVDYSKTSLDGPAVAALVALAEAADVAGKRKAMFAGAPINATENRPVLHVALRAAPDEVFVAGGRNVVPDVQAVLAAMSAFAEGVRSGAIAAADGKPFTDVVNIGIGGSDLGPAMATRALRPFHDGPRTHFVSNVDGAHLRDTIAGLDPARTLFLVASKTFTTIETMTNARSARAWIAGALGEAAVAHHFAAISTALDKVAAFGIPADRIFGFWDWVGGRYSVWSAIGLSLMIAIGPVRFRDFLAGARAMDRHFLTAPFAANLPVLLALVGIWHRHFWSYRALAVLPYDQRLERFPAYLQQLDMESNGKWVGLDGHHAHPTGPLVFGEPGTNGQHAFYQWLHQGSDPTPCEFLLAAEGDQGADLHHDLLVANCLAQSEALMKGRSFSTAKTELEAAGMAPDKAATLTPHKFFPGNRPSVTILYRRLDPFTLGQLIALYEHKVFVQGAIWGVNSFDQWGVELGKEYATALLPAVEGSASPPAGSASAGLIVEVARLRKAVP